jgi:hypothetical protein
LPVEEQGSRIQRLPGRTHLNDSPLMKEEKLCFTPTWLERHERAGSSGARPSLAQMEAISLENMVLLPDA